MKKKIMESFVVPLISAINWDVLFFFIIGWFHDTVSSLYLSRSSSQTTDISK